MSIETEGHLPMVATEVQGSNVGACGQTHVGRWVASPLRAGVLAQASGHSAEIIKYSAFQGPVLGII